ncbi:MerR family transcriptional regulator [Pararhodospirillum oryzae]
MGNGLTPENGNDVESEGGRRTGKSEAAFRTISEVSADLGVPQHVLRFWETKFSQIRPMKRGGGRRYYRPEDVVLLAAIRDLLYNDGYTIRGAQKLLREHGVRAVLAQGSGRGGPLGYDDATGADDEGYDDDSLDVDDMDDGEEESPPPAPPPRHHAVQQASHAPEPSSGKAHAEHAAVPPVEKAAPAPRKAAGMVDARIVGLEDASEAEAPETTATPEANDQAVEKTGPVSAGPAFVPENKPKDEPEDDPGHDGDREAGKDEKAGPAEGIEPEEAPAQPVVLGLSEAQRDELEAVLRELEDLRRILFQAGI